MTVLEFAVERLAEVIHEPKLDEEELLDIRREIDQLSSDIREAILDRHLQDFLLDQLEAMRRGIFEYQIRGPERLKEALATVVGNLIVEHYAGENIMAGTETDTLASRFLGIVNRFAATVTFAANSTQLIESVRRLLPGGG